MHQPSLFGSDIEIVTGKPAAKPTRSARLQAHILAGAVCEPEGPIVGMSSDIAATTPEALSMAQEGFWVLTLTQRHQIIRKHLVHLGSLTASLVHPREVYRVAIMDSAAAVAFIHNHPGGDPTPSPEDLQLTKRLRDAGTLLGIRVIDHVIIGAHAGRVCSFADEGLFN